MRETALTTGVRKPALDRLDHAGRAVGYDQQRVSQPAGAHVLEEGSHCLGAFPRRGHQMHLNASRSRREDPDGHHRFAPEARADTIVDAFNEDVDGLLPAQVPLGDVPVVPPELLADLGDCNP